MFLTTHTARSLGFLLLPSRPRRDNGRCAIRRCLERGRWFERREAKGLQCDSETAGCGARRDGEVLVLSGDDVRAAADMRQVIDAVRSAYIEYSAGKAVVPIRI